MPAVPLAVAAANTTVGAVSAAVLAAGTIPVLATLAGAGALATAGTLVRAGRKAKSRPGVGRVPHRARSARAAARSIRRARTGGLSRTNPHRAVGAKLSRAGGAGMRRHGVAGTGRPRPTARGRAAAARAGRASARPTRQSRRLAATTARRSMSDARRAARAANSRRTAHRPGARPGLVARRAGAARAASRARRDARTTARLTARRRNVRHAPARRAARRQLGASRRRYWSRRALAAALALPVGALGMVSSPIGRRIGAEWMIHPGRRLHQRLAGDARTARHQRDKAIRKQHAQDVAAQENERITATGAPRAPRHHQPTTLTNSGDEMAGTTGFLFEQSASDMETAALNYAPDGAMHVLATIKGFPDALTSIANVFRILAERCDSAFPVNSDVGAALAEVHNQLIHAVNAAEEAHQTFRRSHSDDIARHEAPRAGEPMWDTTNND